MITQVVNNVILTKGKEMMNVFRTLQVFRIVLVICYLCTPIHFLVATGDVPLPPYAAWWERNAGKDVSHATLLSWWGDIEAPSRIALREYILDEKFKSILDIGSGLLTDYYSLEKAGVAIKYTGVDTSDQFVDYAKNRGVNVIKADVESLPFKASQFDVVSMRHLLEHLPSYQRAISEMIRVAKKEVIIIFFIKPQDDPTEILSSIENNYLLYHNKYNRDDLEEFIESNSKVNGQYWEEVNDKEVMLHIVLDSRS